MWLSEIYFEKLVFFNLVNLIGNLMVGLRRAICRAGLYRRRFCVMPYDRRDSGLGCNVSSWRVLCCGRFGKRVVPHTSSGMGCLSLICNIIWLICGGLYTALVHVVFALLLAITIIGVSCLRDSI